MAIPYYQWPIVATRATFCALFFIFGCLSARTTQILAWGALKGLLGYFAAINLTKVHFVTILTFMTQIATPCKVLISYDPAQLSGSSFRVVDGQLVSSLLPNAVWISNHQLYLDWLFLWFITYSARFADSVSIVLKANLAKLPILGPGMENFRFLFLLRRWETDKILLTNTLLEIDADARGLGPSSGMRCVSSTNSTTPGIVSWPEGTATPNKIWPYHLFIFPEGTVLSPHTRERSNKFVDSMGRPKLRHVLLPRVRGIFLMLRLLRNTVEVVYDVTTAYSGLRPDQYGEDEFTLKSIYLLGYGPSAVNYSIRGWNISDIPLGDSLIDIDDVPEEDLKKFEEWLYTIWYEKDELMLRFYKTGSFVEEGDEKMKTVVADFKLRSMFEALQPFMVPATAVVVARLVLKGLWKVVPYLRL